MEIKRILQLSPEVIGQIAAGEVVERPAAAIKELVENSMDAGATAVTVDIQEGGLSSFRVTDNGSGIRPEDIKMAFARHATSKIRTAEELFGVRSLGFRGEALASIAAVAKVTCRTRAKGQETGISLRNEGGQIMDLKEAACPEGTSFTVKELFYNAPVRRKFLKKASTETSAVSELMARLILSRPDISFRFVADGKTVFFSPGDGKTESAVMSVYGLQTLKLLTKIDGRMNGVLLTGYVGVGDASRGNRSHEHFFLNGRAMKSGLLSAAVENACRQRVTIGRFPVCVLYLTMPFEAADVNVHPNKWEVRFQDEKAVRAAVETILLEALTKTDEAPIIPPMYLEPADQPKPERAMIRTAEPSMPIAKIVPKDTRKTLSAFTEDGSELPEIKPLPSAEKRAYPLPPRPETKRTALHDAPTFLTAPRPILEKKPEIPSFVKETAKDEPRQLQAPQVEKRFEDREIRIIGVAFNTYILLEYGDILILCDQHAVHERLLYEKFMKETTAAPASQSLLIPLVLRLTKTEYAVYEENREVLQNAGFDLSPFGEDEIQLRGVPIILGQPQAEKCLLDALDTLTTGKNTPLADRTTRVIQMACKHAVKGGERLPEDSVKQLIRDIMEQKVPPTCPHGRPLMVQISHTELDKRFRRIQN